MFRKDVNNDCKQNSIFLKVIQKIERKAFPIHMQSFKDCKNMDDVAIQCKCSLNELVLLMEEERWYALLSVKNNIINFVDIAKDNENVIVPWKDIANTLTNILKQNKIIDTMTMHTREKTSHKLIKMFLKMFPFKSEIEGDQPWQCGDETMHELRIHFARDNKN